MHAHHHVSTLVVVLWGPLGLGFWIVVGALIARRRPTDELES